MKRIICIIAVLVLIATTCFAQMPQRASREVELLNKYASLAISKTEFESDLEGVTKGLFIARGALEERRIANQEIRVLKDHIAELEKAGKEEDARKEGTQEDSKGKE